MGGISGWKKENIQRVRQCFYQESRPWSRSELVKSTGLSMGSAENILQLLQRQEEVLYTGDAPSTGGRKSKQYELNPDYAHIGILFLFHEIGQYFISLSVIDLKGKRIFHTETQSHSSPGADDLRKIREAVLKSLLVKDPKIRCLIISIPGAVAEGGTVRSNDFPGLSGSAFHELFSYHFPVPVVIENDVNLAAIGYGKQKPECESLAVLYQPDSDPAGAGILIHGRLLRGFGGFAGELGHIQSDGQLRLLHKEPLRLMKLQIETLTCVISPQRIAWYCPLVHTDIRPDSIPDRPSDTMPVLERLTGLNNLSRSGAEVLGRRWLLRHPDDPFKPAAA